MYEIPCFDPFQHVLNVPRLLFRVIPGGQALVFDAGQVGKDAGGKKPCVQLGIDVQNLVSLPQKIHGAVEEHHALALLGLGGENEEFALLDRRVFVQRREFEGNPGVSVALAGLDLLPAEVNDLAEERNVVCVGIFGHDVVDDAVNLLFDVVLTEIHAQGLAFAEPLDGVAPEGGVEDVFYADLILFHGAAGKKIAGFDQLVELFDAELFSGGARGLGAVQNLQNIEGVDGHDAFFGEILNRLIDDLVTSPREVVRVEIFGIIGVFRAVNQRCDDAGLAFRPRQLFQIEHVSPPLKIAAAVVKTA